MKEIESPAASDIRAAREAVGHTQQQAADQVYVTKRQWQNWESGVHPMTRAHWELYCFKTGQYGRVKGKGCVKCAESLKRG